VTNDVINNANNNLMTKEEVIAKYGDVRCYFSGYYKHTFEFIGYYNDSLKEVTKITVCVGGSADDIYKLNINPETAFKISDESVILVHITLGGRALYQESRI
jgi:hypothetical protein